VEPTILYNDIAFIRITEFNENTPNEFKKEIEKAIKEKPKGIIFDVRNNPGGLLDSVVSVLDSLVPKGTIVTLNYKEGLLDDKGKPIQPNVYSSDEKEVALPMAVLINENTASAGELFTSTLRDFKKAKLIGEKTYGKGVGQQTFNLGDETALRLTTFTYTPPSGENYDGKGILPDFEVALPRELENNIYALTFENDVQLQKALTVFG
jgi:carboxyl-terminal processing protease